jgi:hypothetical protein
VTAPSSPFGDARLDANLASILSLDDKRTPSDLVTPVQTRQGAWQSLQLSRQASATIAASLGCALLASAALLMRAHPPAKPLSVEVVPMASQLPPRRVAEFQPAADAPTPIIKVTNEDLSSQAPQAAHDQAKHPFERELNSTSRQPARTEVATASLAVSASGMPTHNNNSSIDPVQSPALLASNENPASSAAAMFSTEPRVAGEPKIVEQVGSLPQLKRSRRASIDAMRFLRRQ